MYAGEKQAATHVSLDQEYDQDLAVMWCHLEEQLVAAANRGIVPATFHPTQCCLNSQTDNLRFPLAVAEGERSSATSTFTPYLALGHTNARQPIRRHYLLFPLGYLLSIRPSFCPHRANHSGGDVQEPSEGSSGSVQPLTTLEVHCRGCNSIRREDD